MCLCRGAGTSIRRYVSLRLVRGHRHHVTIWAGWWQTRQPNYPKLYLMYLVLSSGIYQHINNFICWKYNNLKSKNLILLRKYVVIQNNIKITIVVQDKVWDNLAQMWKTRIYVILIFFFFRSIQNNIWVLTSTSAACTAMFIILDVNLTHQLMMINTLFHHLFSLMKPF